MKMFKEIYNKIGLLIILFSCMFISIVKSQDSTKIDLDRIFTKKEFASASSGIYNWFDDEHGYFKKIDGKNGKEIVAVHPATGTIHVIVPAEKLIPKGSIKPISIKNFSFSNDKKKCLITSDGLAGKNEINNYWILDLLTWEFIKIQLDDLLNKTHSVELSPNGQMVSFVSDCNIYIQNIYTSERKQITFDGSSKILNGYSLYRFDAVNNVTGLKWSPDSRYVAYVYLNAEKVKTFKMINNTDSIYPEIISFQYVKPGEDLPEWKLGIISISDGSSKWINLPEDHAASYITNYDWNPITQELMVQLMNRKQNEVKVYLSDVSTGNIINIWGDNDTAFLTPFNPIWIDKGQNFIWVSEKDGWRHIYKISHNGMQTTLLTPGNYDVDAIQCIDEKRGSIYFTASPENAIYRYLYKVGLDENSKMQRITPEGFKGVHSYSVSPGCKWAFHTFSNMNTPPTTEIISLADHQTLKVIENNSKLKAILSKIEYSPSEFLKVDIGNGIKLDAWCIKPPDFDSTKKYPVIFHVYSMPGGQFVIDRWMGDNYMWYQMMAQKGFIVMNVDSRGTPSLYGREWRKVIYKKHGLLPSDEQAAAVKALTSQRQYMDASRVGICGWSGGGMISLLQILRFPDLYNTAIPGAYLCSNRLYQAGFTERFMGLPQENKKEYDETEALNYVDGLKGNLLLMHGTADDNVNYQSTEVLISKLIAHKKRFFVMPYPNRSHSMLEGVNTKFHQYDMYTWFFSMNLLPK